MASIIVLVLPVPKLLNCWSTSEEKRSTTHGPKITKAGEPGGSFVIDITACACCGLDAISGLKNLDARASVESIRGSDVV